MMSDHGANPIFFNKKNNDWTSRTLANPHPLHPITSQSHFCLAPHLPFLKVEIIHASPPEKGKNLKISFDALRND